MIDKTAIEKAKEALKEIAETFPTGLEMNGHAFTSDPEWIKMRNNHMIIAQNVLTALDALEAEKPADTFFKDIAKCVEQTKTFNEACALYEAEKPAEDAVEVASSVFDCINKNTEDYPGLLVADCDAGAILIQHFAESYHAEQCKACKGPEKQKTYTGLVR